MNNFFYEEDYKKYIKREKLKWYKGIYYFKIKFYTIIPLIKFSLNEGYVPNLHLSIGFFVKNPNENEENKPIKHHFYFYLFFYLRISSYTFIISRFMGNPIQFSKQYLIDYKESKKRYELVVSSEYITKELPKEIVEKILKEKNIKPFQLKISFNQAYDKNIFRLLKR